MIKSRILCFAGGAEIIINIIIIPVDWLHTFLWFANHPPLRKSSKRHPVSAQSWSMWAFAGRLTLVCPCGVIYQAFYFGVARSQMNGAPIETGTHSWRFAKVQPANHYATQIALVYPCVGVHRKTLFLSYFSLLQQCPEFLAWLTWMDCEMCNEWQYPYDFTWWYCQHLFNWANIFFCLVSYSNEILEAALDSV